MMKKGKVVGVIPSRWGSTRFPGKSLALIAGKPLVVRVLERVRLAKRLDEAWVATDDERIARAVEAGCIVACGSDAGAVLVPHGQGTCDEYDCFAAAIPDAALRDARLAEGEAFIRETFRRK